jgi:hypothetical protein
MKMAVFWDFAASGLVVADQCYNRTHVDSLIFLEFI